jgi:DNA polymerase III delta subunit
MNKLLDFCCQYLKLRLSLDSKNWILEVLENNLPAFYNACFLLKLNNPGSHEIGLPEVQKLLESDKVDHFMMASLFSKKKKKEFYRRITSFQSDFDKMRNLFLFMQSHLLKMVDPSYLSLKSKLTNYDKEIQTTSKLWTVDDLLKEIARFNKLEILSKKKDSNLWHELKVDFFRSP